MINSISAVPFDLATYSVYDSATQADVSRTVQGNYYTVVMDTGELRQLSIAELVMVICLARAAEKEAAIIALMEEMSSNTTLLETLTDVEQAIIDDFNSATHRDPYTLENHYITKGPYAGINYRTFLQNQGVIDGSARWVYLGGLPTPGQDIRYDDLIADIESKMDSLNSFSQQKMIELQSETNKRDQSYDMITNILKSLNTVQIGIANNM